MEKPDSFRRIAILAIIVALLSSAAICGRGQQAPVVTSAPGEAPAVTEAPPANQPPAETEAPAPGGGEAIDLFFSQASVEPTSNPGEVRVTLAVRNKGQGQVTSSFTVRWYPHGKSDVVGCTWDVGAKKINQGEVTLDCKYTYPQKGQMNWMAVVDPDSDVAEVNEDNNTQKGEVSIQVGGGGGAAVKPPTNCAWKVASVPRNIILTWEYAGAQDVDGFRIYMATTDLVMTVGPNDLMAMVQNLALTTQYHFDVRAFKGASESPADACAVDATTGQ